MSNFAFPLVRTTAHDKRPLYNMKVSDSDISFKCNCASIQIIQVFTNIPHCGDFWSGMFLRIVSFIIWKMQIFFYFVLSFIRFNTAERWCLNRQCSVQYILSSGIFIVLLAIVRARKNKFSFQETGCRSALPLTHFPQKTFPNGNVSVCSAYRLGSIRILSTISSFAKCFS